MSLICDVILKVLSHYKFRNAEKEDHPMVANEITEAARIRPSSPRSTAVLLRKFKTGELTMAQSAQAPLMILRGTTDARRVELHYKGKLLMALERDGRMYLGDIAVRHCPCQTELYEALRQWIEIASGGRAPAKLPVAR